MRFLENLARTAFALIAVPALIAFCSIGTIVQRSLFRSSVASTTWAYRILSSAFIACSGTRVQLHGQEHVVPGQAYVIVSNHESNLDPFALMHALPGLVIRFVVKRQLIGVPLFGLAMALSGNIPVDRTRGPGSGDVRRIQETMARRDPRISLLFFAEGTRSRDGRLHPFKKGAFATAIAAGLPVLPVAIAGTRYVHPPHRIWLRRGGIAIEVGAPIHVGPQSARDSLHEEAFKAVAELRAKARARVRAAGHEPGGLDS